MSQEILAILGVIVASLVSLVGISVLLISEQRLRGMLFFLVSVSAGALFGDVFFHLIPESFELFSGQIVAPATVLSGILFFFALEKFLHWHHHHRDEGEPDENTIHPVGVMTIVSDIAHNFVDGVIIAGSFLVDTTLGVATLVAVIFHEIPHEIGNVSLLIHAGFSRVKAILYNCFSALASLFGALLVIFFGSKIEGFANILIPFAAGAFIYIAGSDLVPALHKDIGIKKSLIQLLGLLLGIILMMLLLVLE